VTARSSRIASVFAFVLLAAATAVAPAQAPTPSPQGPPAPAVPDPDPDQVAQQRLAAVYAQTPALLDVTVTVANGVVQLAGEVPTREARQRAIGIAEKTAGVAHVVDLLQEPGDLRRRLLPTFERLAEIGRGTLALLPLLAIAALVLVVFWWLGKFVAGLGVLDRVPANKLLQSVLRQMLRLVIVMVGAVLALEVLDATALVGAMLGAAGVVGLALGLAFRDLIENYLASIMLSLRHPFRVGDAVDIDGRAGSVVRMTMRDTVLMTPDGNHLTLPNATVFKSPILNMTTNPLRRFEVALAIAPAVDPAAVERVGLDILQRLAGVAAEPAAIARFGDLGRAGMRVQFFAWVDQRQVDYGKVVSEAQRLLRQAAKVHGFAVPAPRLVLQREAREGGAASGREPKPQQAVGQLRREASRADVAPSDPIQQQIREERARSSDEDLLSSNGSRDQAPVDATPAPEAGAASATTKPTATTGAPAGGGPLAGDAKASEK
jgi:small conductance mechanosensitive channel